ncbi:integrase, catalytic region, zinc finger, CCHC-type containing protein, partial [Tanacetum coccineum]
FGNDHVAKIMGYGDYQMGNVTTSRVYYMEGLGHNLFSVGQIYVSDLEVAFRKHTCFIRDLEGVDLLKTLRAYYEEVGISHQTFIARTPQQNGVVERQNRTLVEAARTMMIFSNALKPDLSYLHVFGALCYPTNDSEALDAPSISISQTNQETPSLVIPLGVEEADHDIEVAHMDNNPSVDFPIPEPSSEKSSS